MHKLHLLAFIILLTACSAPIKYSYYFDHTSQKPKQVKAAKSQTTQKVEESSSVYASIADASPIVREIPNSTTKRSNELDVKPSNKTKREFRKEIKEELKSLVGSVRKSPASVKSAKADTKDGWAIAGFVCSLVGLIILWPLCILGVIFSAIGLKSEKRGLAIAGLVLGIIGLVLVLILGAALVAA